MEKCKFCQADLAENGTFCPNCGKNNAEEAAVEETIVVEAAVEETTVVELVAEETVVLEQPAAEQTTAEETVPETKEEKKATPGKIAIMVTAIVLVIALIAGLVLSGTAKPAAPAAAAGGLKVTCPLPGTVLSINVKEGDTVAAGQTVVVLEAMKMENNIDAERGGVVKQVLVSAGATVMEGDVLLVIE